MRKILVLLLFAAIVSSASAQCATCIGDVDGDGWVRPPDIPALVTLLTACGAPMYRCPSSVNPCADINGDGWIRSSDISALAMVISGFGPPTYRCRCGTSQCP